MFADIKVLSFDTLLGIFYSTGNIFMFNRLILFNADSIHNPGYSLRAEYTQKVIFQRKIKARRPIITLTS